MSTEQNTNEVQGGGSGLNDGLDAERFRFIEKHKIKCVIRDNGYWEASGFDNDIGWVSRKMLAQCIDVLMRYNAELSRRTDESK